MTNPLPAEERHAAFQAYLDASAELPDDGPEVCTIHQRFRPCRSAEPHDFTTDSSKVEQVRRYQQGSDD